MTEYISAGLSEEMIAAFIMFHVQRGEEKQAYEWAQKLGPRFQMPLELEPKNDRNTNV